jgi:hypothetical protein
MTAGRLDPMTRLAAADPARDLCLDADTKARVAQRLSDAMRARPSSPRPSRSRWPGWRRTSLIAIAVGLLMVGAAFGGGLIQLGAPARTSEGFTTPRAGFGALTLGTARLLAIATPDPHGGPPWGLRVFSTTRGVGCIQVGRLLDGRIGALGQDGAFGDDGRFHELPVRSVSVFTCSALDANGRIFNNVSKGDELANAWPGRETCVPSVASPAEKGFVSGKICPQADERDLFYGLLGPYAKSITYTSRGNRKTVATVGPEGAYLIVTDAPVSQLYNTAGSGATDVVPVDGPITEVHYHDGSTCHLTARSWIGGASACTPPLRVPVGYAPVGKPPTRAQVATPVHVHLVRNRKGIYEAILGFRSRISVNSDRALYKIEWRQPKAPRWKTRSTGTDENIAAGQAITARTGPLPRGVTDVQAILQYSSGPALLEGPGTIYLPVDRLAIRVP